MPLKSDNGRTRMTKLTKAARRRMTAPNLMAAGAVALGAAAFAYLRDGQRRSHLKDTARRGRDTLKERWHGTMGRRAGQPEPVFP